MATINEFNHIKDVIEALDELKPSRFGYVPSVLTATGAAEISSLTGVYTPEDTSQINSIPTPSQIEVDEQLISTGLRGETSSLSRMAVNHFFGRLGLNLIKVTEKMRLLIEDHLVHRYITPSGNVMENLTVTYAEDSISLIKHISPLSASAPVTASAAITLSPAAYGVEVPIAGIMSGTDKRKLDNTRDDVDIIFLKLAELLDYSRSDFPKVKNNSNRTVYCLPKNVTVRINNIVYSRTAETNLELNINQVSIWDDSSYATASNRAGKDFYVYACVPVSGLVPDFILSANSTFPTGKTADNSRKIGGFHCLCSNVGNNVYAYFNEGKDAYYINNIFADGSSITTGATEHWLYGWLQGDILPFSCWDLLHRPNLNADVEGRVYNPKINKWVMIYLPSWSAGLLKSISVYGGAVSSGVTSPAFHWYRWDQVLANQGEMMLIQREFVSTSLGSPQGVNISGSSNPVTTGGHIATDGLRIISLIGCEDMTGVFFQWIEGRGGVTQTSNSNAYTAADKNVAGQDYSLVSAGLLGGSWNRGVICGSRGGDWRSSPLTVYGDYSCRAASEPFFK